MNWWLSPELLTLIVLISSCTCKHDCSIGSKAILNLMRVGRPAVKVSDRETRSA